MRCLLTSLLCVVLAASLVTVAKAQERRCTELGVNCICSEPLQMTVLTPVASSWYNPNDSITKQCNGENVAPGAAIVRNTNDLVIGSDPTVLAALPGRSTVARYLQGPPGHTGIFFLGHTFTGGEPTARTAIRWYRYYSSDYAFPGESGCGNSKLLQGQQTSGFNVNNGFGGSTQIYGWLSGWRPSVDCCFNGPNGGVTTTSAEWKGKWWRFELVIGERSGRAPTYFKFYRKDVTNDLPEQTLIDTSFADLSAGPHPWTATVATTLTPTSPPLNHMWVSGYRQDTCRGYSAWSHLMYSAWTTDAGQRIGAAAEVEGRGGVQ